MGINQAIFTSSAQGISKGGGMGIHTYNYSCSEAELEEFELSYCQYYYDGDASEIPGLPTKIVYGKTAGGRYIEAAVTYLGKDYDKERGRMGNLLSHMYSFSREDIRSYPMQLYASPDYRTSISLEEVDGTNPIKYLPEVTEVKPGEVGTIGHVQDFLGNGRMDMFCHLMGAVLERDDIHKIIIYDIHENIVMWLAAIEYALPMRCAKEITFSSYEKDPTMSEFDVRGAVVGMSRGNCYEYAASGQFYVFDGVNKEYPKFDISPDYYQYGIEMGLAFSYDSMLEFFKFMGRYNYEQADRDICLGFKLFQMLQGGMERLGEKEFRGAISFEKKYGNKKSYREMLVQLFEKLESNGDSDENFLTNIRMLLIDYYKKELNEDELEFIISLSIDLEKYVKGHYCDEQANDSMWSDLYELMVGNQREYLDFISNCLIIKGAYEHLGELEAYMFSKSGKQELMRAIQIIFQNYWLKVPREAYVYFDPLVREVVKVLRSYEEDDDKYLLALEIFLLIQKLGEGFIAGRGCEQLISIIERGTQLIDKKQFVAKKKKAREELEKQQSKCAFEAFNYTQRNQADLPIAKIRLQHLGRCIIKTYEDEILMTKSKALSIYSEYPIYVDHISDDEFRTYIEQLAKVIYTMETSKEEYHLLLTYWILNEKQKIILLEILIGCEIDYLKKEKQVIGLEALLNAIREMGDNEYAAALKEIVSNMKNAQKEKITEVIRSRNKGKLYIDWLQIASSEDDKGEKRGFFKFGKH